MNHTTNYQLNQWSADDRVQRIDFNADNAKIDAALKANADAAASTAAALEDRYALHLIKSANVISNTVLTLDVSDVNWAAWRQVLLLVDLKMTGPFVKVDAAGPGNSYTIANCNKSVTFPVLLFPFYRNDVPVSGLSLGNNSSVGVLTQLTYQTITAFRTDRHYEATVLPGSSFSLYGIK